MKRLFKNKKGSAIESAILFMLVISSLIMLIASVNVFGMNKANVYNKKFEDNVYLSKIGENFVKDVKTNAAQEGSSINGEYTVTVTITDNGTEEIYELTARHSENNDGLNVAVRKSSDGEFTVLRWRKII